MRSTGTASLQLYRARQRRAECLSALVRVAERLNVCERTSARPASRYHQAAAEEREELVAVMQLLNRDLVESSALVRVLLLLARISAELAHLLNLVARVAPVRSFPPASPGERRHALTVLHSA